MNKQKRVSHPIYGCLPVEVPGFESLAELALDLRRSGNHADDNLWRQFDPVPLDLTHNPWVVLQTVSRDQPERARNFMQATGQPFNVALAVTRAGNLFTTHTAVPGGCVHRAAVSAVRPPADYTARTIPLCAGAAIPLEDARILWQR